MSIKILNNASIVIGKYYISNNLWGSKNEFGYQYIKSNNNDENNISWITKWNWRKSKETIKSYASVVLGWHWGWKNKNTELPINIGSITNIKSEWDFKLEQKTEGKVNVCYDLWLSNKLMLENEDPTDEIMIWLYKTEAITPIGKFIKKVNIEGVYWDLWIGLHPSTKWTVHSYIRNENTESQLLDINDFIKYSTQNKEFKSNNLMSIESGIEVFEGKGSLRTKKYCIEIYKS